MALLPLNLCQDLQPWHNAGVSYLFFPDVDNVQALLNIPASRIAGPPVKTRSDTDTAAGASASKTAPASSVKQPEATSAHIVDDVAAKRSEPPVITDFSRLPKPWQTLLEKVQPAPVAWSYLELGEDLLVKGDKQRSSILKQLIGGLRLGAGTNTFLPVTLPGLSAQESSLEGAAFNFALSNLKSKILIFLGKDALAKSPYAYLSLSFFQEKVADGRLVLCLPDLMTLSADSAKLDATIIYLRSALVKIKLL